MSKQILCEQVDESIFNACWERFFPSGTADKLPKFILDKTQDVFPGYIEVSLLLEYPCHQAKFFWEMITKGLCPGKTLFIASFFSTVQLKNNQQYMLICSKILIEEQSVWEQVHKHFSIWQKEILSAIKSTYQAQRILEMKGYTYGDKVSFLHEKITSYLYRFPSLFDYDVYPVFQKFMLSVAFSYKQQRSSRQLVKIILLSYRLMNRLVTKGEKKPHSRHIFCHLGLEEVDSLLGPRKVIHCFVALNLLKSQEVFTKKHLSRALESTFLKGSVIEESFFSHTESDGKHAVYFMEIEHPNRDFTMQDIQQAQSILQRQIAISIGYLVQPVFMPRNEEEILKYTVTLAHQIQTPKDCPQIVILFDEQRDEKVFFTVIIARVRSKDDLQDILCDLHNMDIIWEKTKEIGFKEIAVLHVGLDSTLFLREDFSLNLYQARQNIVHAIQDVLGDIRDYNGGMIAQQIDVLEDLKKQFTSHQEHEHFLEIFFHALQPVEMRSSVDLPILKKFYSFFKKIFYRKGIIHKFLHKTTPEADYYITKVTDPQKAMQMLQKMQQNAFCARKMIRLYLPLQESIFLGCIFLSDCKQDKEKFYYIFQSAIEVCFN